MKPRVVITGMGCVTPLGHDVESLWKAILAVESGISKTELFDSSTFPTTFSAQVKGYKLPSALADSPKHTYAGRHTRFALGAAAQAWRQSGLDRSEAFDPRRTGIYLGSGEGSLDFENFNSMFVDAWDKQANKIDTVRWAKMALERLEVHREQEQEANMVVAHLAAEFGIRGPAFNVLTACAASTQAIGEATMMLRHGEVDAIVAGGAHSMVHPYGITGFNRLTALSTRNDDIPHASRPFDQTRDGFVLGEGASILILENYEFAKKRGATILAEIVGYGSSADAYRITDQDPDGAGAAAGMRAALADAGIRPDQIDYISAHGTGTQQNDQVESRAVKAVFGDHARKLAVSSAKSMLGHLIAAAGATELITCVLALRDQILPPTANRTTADADCDLDYVPCHPRKAKVDYCMKNSFGFGGQNDTLIVTRDIK